MDNRQRGQLQPGAVGKLGEEAIKQYLERRYGSVQDVRAVPSFQQRDIDFITPNQRTYEVKTDTWLHKTGNLFFETVRHHGKAGCFYRSKADHWCYVDAETGTAYVFLLSEAQAWVSQHFKAEWFTETRSHRGTNFVTFIGLRVPLTDFLAGVETDVISLSL